MTQSEQQRMILRRTGDEAATSAEVADRVKDIPDITLLQENAPSTLLVEGSPDAIVAMVSSVAGWSAMPMARFQVPDTRPRVLRPAAK